MSNGEFAERGAIRRIDRMPAPQHDFDAEAAEIDVRMDEVAERLRAGGFSAADAAKAARVVLSMGWRNEAAAEENESAERGEVVRRILTKIWEAPKPQLAAGVLLIALDFRPMALRGGERRRLKSLRDLAGDQVVSVEAVCNVLDGWRRVLELPKLGLEKSNEAKATYGLTNGAGKTAA